MLTGVLKTLALMIQHAPNESNEMNWPHIRNDVCTVLCDLPKWTPGIKLYGCPKLSPTFKPMERIAIDTIGPSPNGMGFKCIIVIIDTFTRHVELYPKQEVTAIAAADTKTIPNVFTSS